MSDAVTGLAADRALLDRTSTAERVADILRTRIIEGYFPPGTRLSELTIVKELGISRNTLREAFRLLTHERLLMHEMHRGASVRKLTIEDVVDLYRVRKAVECAAVRQLDSAGHAGIDSVGRAGIELAARAGIDSAGRAGIDSARRAGIDRIEEAVADGERAAESGDWGHVGTANLRYHQAIVALAESPRLDDLMRGVLAELRLVFHVMADPRRFYEPYLARNREIVTRMRAGDVAGADTMLAEYLADAERQLVEAYASKAPQP